MDPIRANMYGSVRFDNANAPIEILESELWIPLLEPGRVSGEVDKLVVAIAALNRSDAASAKRAVAVVYN